LRLLEIAPRMRKAAHRNHFRPADDIVTAIIAVDLEMAFSGITREGRSYNPRETIAALAHVGGVGIKIESETRRERDHDLSPAARKRQVSSCASMSPEKWINRPLGNSSVQGAAQQALGSSGTRLGEMGALVVGW